MPDVTYPIVLDVDTGTDDALAILFALAHPAIELLGITCVSGNVDVHSVVANTFTVLDAAGAPEVPVGRGASQPLIGTARDASDFHGPDGLGGLRHPSSRTVSSTALALMERLLDVAEEPVTIVALGPQTNIATLVLARPDLVARIRRIVFMGGAMHTGNVTATAEFNVWHDPEAAEIVLRSGVPITMYPLEPFMSVRIEDPAALPGLAGDLVRARHSGGIGDAGALVALVAPELIEVSTVPVSVALSGPERGQTILDRREWSEEPANAEVIVDIDPIGAAREFSDALTGRVAEVRHRT